MPGIADILMAHIAYTTYMKHVDAASMVYENHDIMGKIIQYHNRVFYLTY